MTRNPYHAEDCRKVLVASQPGGMVELLINDTYSVMIPAAEARGLAHKLVIVAFLSDGDQDKEDS